MAETTVTVLSWNGQVIRAFSSWNAAERYMRVVYATAKSDGVTDFRCGDLRRLQFFRYDRTGLPAVTFGLYEVVLTIPGHFLRTD